MQFDSIFFLENLILIIVPIVFFLVIDTFFKFIRKHNITRLLIIITALSIVGFLFVGPRCLGIGVEQLTCTAVVASLLSCIVFFFGIIIALVICAAFSRLRH
jgi:cytochrome c biogenesis factor